MADLSTAHWRDSARRPRFFVIDAYAVFPIFIWLFNINMATFIFACCCIAFFVIIERFGFTVPVFMRWLRAFAAGPLKKARW